MFEIQPNDDMVVPCGNVLGTSLNTHSDFYTMAMVTHGAFEQEQKLKMLHTNAEPTTVVGEEDSMDADNWSLFGEMIPFDDAVLPHTPPRSPHPFHADALAHAHSDSHVPSLSITIPPLSTDMPALSAERDDDEEDDEEVGYHDYTYQVKQEPAAGYEPAQPTRSSNARSPAAAATTTTATTTASRTKCMKRSTKPKTATKLLPLGHKPARGRGRQLQLAKMTSAQKRAEAEFRLEKNRQAARDFRLRRKNQVQVLEEQLQVFADRDLKQQQQIARLRAHVARLQAAMRS